MILLFVGIPQAFAYLDYLWPVMAIMASFAAGWICGGCAQRN